MANNNDVLDNNMLCFEDWHEIGEVDSRFDNRNNRAGNVGSIVFMHFFTELNQNLYKPRFERDIHVPETLLWKAKSSPRLARALV